MLVSTFSIVGRDGSGQLGMAVSSRVIGVGAHCAFVVPRRVAISSQAYSNPFLPYAIVHGLDAGRPVVDAARAAVAADEHGEWRQLVAIGPDGPPFAHTGSSTDPWNGHLLGDDCAAAGNLLVSGDTVTGLVETFEARSGEPLAERLLAALEAGQAAGGDRRGRQSAALLVRAATEVAVVDLRVDEHPDPIGELRRVFELVPETNRERNLRAATSGELLSLPELQAVQRRVRAELG
jgi:uncharacterized Ntn-hydrolase superfamily protein